MNSTVSTEVMLGCVSTEGVGRETALSFEQLEVCSRNDEMKKALHGADRAVAVQRNLSSDDDTKAYGSAVTTSCADHGLFG